MSSRERIGGCSALAAARFLRGGGFDGGTQLLVWSEGLGADVEPVTCGELPVSDPLAVRMSAVYRDEQGSYSGFASFPLSQRSLKITIGAEPLPVEEDFGQVDVATELECLICGAPGVQPIQTWVTPIMTANGRFSVAFDALELEGVCP
ncbi:MAG: hypothetical protein GY842_17710 [bacterium]|nr:hypothetical protein [bacterium]